MSDRISPDLEPVVKNERLICNCGSDLGELVVVQGGAQLLHSGNLLIREGHSMYCINCGRSIHWSVSDKHEEHRIKQELKARAPHA